MELIDDDFDLADLKKYRIDPKSEAKYNETMRSLLNQTIDIKEAAERGEDDHIEEATSIIQKADEVVKKSKCSSTAYLDAQILHTTALMYKNCVERMDSRLSEFKANDFADNILAYVSSKSSEKNVWKSIEEVASLAFRNAPGCTWLYGAIDVEVQQVPQRERRKKENLIDAPVKKPDKVKSVEKTDEDLDLHMQAGMKLILKWERSNKEPLQFWHFVLNPDSFSETIENIFFVSHLVKEKLVYVGLDREGLPVIKAIRKEQSVSSSNSSSIPVAVTLDPEQWKSLIKTFGITKSMFPTRGHAVSSGSKEV